MTAEKGMIAFATAGKEKGRALMIVEVIDEKLVLVADGKRRPLERPKKKSLKHLSLTSTVLCEITSNKKLRQTLNSFTGG